MPQKSRAEGPRILASDEPEKATGTCCVDYRGLWRHLARGRQAGREVAVQDGSDDLAAWLDRHGPALLLFARQWVGSHADAEDVVQEAFVGFWRSRARVRDAVPYLYRCVRRAALVWLRTHQRRTRREQIAGRGAAAWFDPGVCSPLESEEQMRRVQGALERLPAAQREVLMLHVWGELTFAQIAAVLKVSPNTAASRYRYALASLRRQLAEGAGC